MSDELKPCPFCGGEPEIRYQGNDYTKSRKITIRCPKCRIERRDAAIKNNFEWLERIAIGHWNTRQEVPK